MTSLGVLQGATLMQSDSTKPRFYDHSCFCEEEQLILNKSCMEEGFFCLDRFSQSLTLENTLLAVQECRKRRSLAQARQLYVYICQHGLENNVFLENFLVSMYVDCESIVDAQQAFKRLRQRNEYSWTSLIHGYVDSGEWKHGLSLFSEMLDDCMQPSKQTFVALLKACARLRDLERGKALHIELVIGGYDEDLFVGSTLVDMYAKCWSLLEAQKVFDSLHIRDVALWNALIKGYQESGFCWEALDCLAWMQAEGVSPNAITFVCVLKACRHVGALEKGKELHADIRKAGLETDLFVGSALVEMYAECGSLALALQVFCNVKTRDVVIWNALITGYAKHGLAEEALSCLEEMQEVALLVTVPTFVCILKACATGGSLSNGLKLHAVIAKRGLETNAYIGTSLVDMYAKCDALIEAMEVPKSLVNRDVVLYNAVIATYAEAGLGDTALSIMELMYSEGILPDTATFACTLKACANLRFLQRARELHYKTIEEGFHTDIIVGNTLVNLYAKCGSLVEAEEVFNEMLFHDVVSWNVLMSGYIENGADENVLGCLEQLELDGIAPSLATLVCSVKACSNLADIQKGRAIHAEIMRESCEMDVLAGTALVAMYARCGLLIEALEIFYELPDKDVVIWSTLIAAFIEQGLGAEALECYSQMQVAGISPNTATYIYTLKACEILDAVDKGQEIHAEVVKKGWEEDSIVGNALVYFYATSAWLPEARALFDSLPGHDVVSWNSIIAGHAHFGHVEDVLDCVQRMQMEAIAPDAVTYMYILKICSERGNIDKVRETHINIVQYGYEHDPTVGNLLVDTYASCGYLTEAQELFDELPIKCVISWKALIDGYVGYELGEEALKLSEQLQQDDLTLDAVACVSVLKACGCVGAVTRGREFHAEITKRGYDNPSKITSLIINVDVDFQDLTKVEATNTIVGTALTDMYWRCGVMAEAQKTFHTMVTKDLITWNVFLVGQARQGEMESVFQLFYTMTKEGIQPDGFTFLCILSVCSHTGLTRKGMDCFETMSKEYGIMPTVEHLNSAVDALGRAGQLDEALGLLTMMPVQPNAASWNTLLGSYIKWGIADFDLCALGDADEDHSIASIVLANIYACAPCDSY